jgi:hypothetical protein
MPGGIETRPSTAFELVLLVSIAAISVGSSLEENNSTADIVAATVLTASTANEDSNKDISQAITIKEVNFAAPSPERENLNGEWVEITNKGSSTQDMNGWKLSDQSNHIYSFKKYSLKAGATVRVHTGQGEDTESDLYWKNKNPIWNNGGDIATLKDEMGDTVTSFSYPKDGDTEEA